jgi:hemoglobin
MEVHYHINRIFPLEEKHFKAWRHLFTTTIDAYFTGTVAELAKTRAGGIASVMEFKMKNERES